MTGFLFGIGLEQTIRINYYPIYILLFLLLLLWKKFSIILLLAGFFIGSLYVIDFQNYAFRQAEYETIKNYQIQIEKPGWESAKDMAIAKIAQSNFKIQVKDDTGYVPGTILEGKAKIISFNNYETLNMQKYWLSKGVIGKIDWENNPQVIGQNLTIKDKIENFRKKLLDILNFSIRPPSNQLAQGLLLGYRAEFDDNFTQNMKNTGTTHIVAISGYNVAIVVAIFFYGLLFLGLNISFFCSCILIGLFVCLVGFDPSVVRAALLALIVLGAKVLGRPYKPEYLLMLIAVIMTILNPLILRYNASFQLSFGAVIGLVYLNPIIGKFKFFKKMPEFFSEALSTTISAQIAVLPILLALFGGFSIISLSANILILPLIPFAMLLVALVMGAGLVSLLFAGILGIGAEVLLEWIIGIINILGSRFPLVQIHWPWWLSLIFYSILFIFVYIFKLKYEEKF